jgi:DNA-directed RNA polymerase specialized sigma24 family protein
MIYSWQQSIAHRVAWPGWRSGRAAAVQQALSVDDDRDLAQIRAAFAQLPAEDQEVLTLQVRGGCSTTEIASALGLTLPQVLARLLRARRELRLACGEDTSWDPEA